MHAEGWRLRRKARRRESILELIIRYSIVNRAVVDGCVPNDLIRSGVFLIYNKTNDKNRVKRLGTSFPHRGCYNGYLYHARRLV